MTRIKQDRTRRSGHKHSQNAQDLPRTVYTPAQKRMQLRSSARLFLAMIRTWGEGSPPEAETTKAVERLIESLETGGASWL